MVLNYITLLSILKIQSISTLGCFISIDMHERQKTTLQKSNKWDPLMLNSICITEYTTKKIYKSTSIILGSSQRNGEIILRPMSHHGQFESF